jgi:hypothetical protein
LTFSPESRIAGSAGKKQGVIFLARWPRHRSGIDPDCPQLQA